MYCRNCGQPIDDNATVCQNCGAYQNKNPNVEDNGGIGWGLLGCCIPCCGTGPVPGLEGYQAQNSKGSWNWCTGVGDSGYPVLFACFCGSPHLWFVELGHAGLAVSLAADYFRLSLPERPFVFLSWETVSNLRPMYR